MGYACGCEETNTLVWSPISLTFQVVITSSMKLNYILFAYLDLVDKCLAVAGRCPENREEREHSLG